MKVKRNFYLLILIVSTLVVISNQSMLSTSQNIQVASENTIQASADQYYVECTAADEDYVNFSSMPGFTNGTSWSIIQRIKLPENVSTFGWSWFRGTAWADKEGDIALQLNTLEESENQVIFWIRKDSSWNSLLMTRNQNGLSLQKDTWYDIAIVFDLPTTTYELYVEGDLADTLVLAGMNDAANDNPLFFGGQYVTSENLEGDLYSECDTAIFHQAWLQRALTTSEIENYNGSVNLSDEALFFSTEITANAVLDASGNGRDGTNGNSPEFKIYTGNSETAGLPALFLICCLGISFSILLYWKRRIIN